MPTRWTANLSVTRDIERDDEFFPLYVADALQEYAADIWEKYFCAPKFGLDDNRPAFDFEAIHHMTNDVTIKVVAPTSVAIINPESDTNG
jgi:hypothetical protein